MYLQPRVHIYLVDSQNVTSRPLPPLKDRQICTLSRALVLMARLNKLSTAKGMSLYSSLCWQLDHLATWLSSPASRAAILISALSSFWLSSLTEVMEDNLEEISSSIVKTARTRDLIWFCPRLLMTHQSGKHPSRTLGLTTPRPASWAASSFIQSWSTGIFGEI